MNNGGLVKRALFTGINSEREKTYTRSGMALFQFSISMKPQMDFWKKLFQRRIKTSFNPTQLKTPKLRELDTGNRLTTDDGSKRIDIATGASEPEREWLFDVLHKHYNS